jgi:hypothetical protein
MAYTCKTTSSITQTVTDNFQMYLETGWREKKGSPMHVALACLPLHFCNHVSTTWTHDHMVIRQQLYRCTRAPFHRTKSTTTTKKSNWRQSAGLRLQLNHELWTGFTEHGMHSPDSRFPTSSVPSHQVGPLQPSLHQHPSSWLREPCHSIQPAGRDPT